MTLQYLKRRALHWTSPSDEPIEIYMRFSCFGCLFAVRQVYTSPSLLGNFPWLDSSGGHSLTYSSPTTAWTSSSFTKTPILPHTPPPLYPTSTSSFPSPGRDSKDTLKAERLSPVGGAGGTFLNLGCSSGSVYPPSHTHTHMLGPYNSYIPPPQDYGPAALYSTAGAWINPPSFSPKMRNKMRLSPPGENIYSYV